MQRIEAETLEDAYAKASQFFGCSLLQLQCEVIQYPSKGVFGFGKKNAIIVADIIVDESVKEANSIKHEPIIVEPTKHIHVSKTHTSSRQATPQPSLKETSKQSMPTKSDDSSHLRHYDDAVSDQFFQNKEELPISYSDTKCSDSMPEPVSNPSLALEIENQLKKLFATSCFAIDIVEVDVIDHTALIFVDGDDAALLIGKEGYRYNALSYMIFNWLYSKYELFVKLEIARFLTSQQEMICYTIKPVIEAVHRGGKGKTRPLDGILVQIALEQLREEFPNKYVAIKTNKEGNKYIVINDFIQKT
ncbi:MAG: Jag N-terminal domain-containing protein [Sulfurovaceae bacterium]|nr:Jag N-terminal domain-containing protein [Sulfurovaceae bacterium]